MIDTQGKLLVAPPGMPDWRFQKTVVYIWRHDVSGACGVIINKKCNHPTFSHVCEEGQVKRKLEIDPPIFYGGPILNNIIGVLHSKDFVLGSSNTGDHPLAFTPKKQSMSWLVIPYDHALVFGPKREDMWEMCVSKAVENKTNELTDKYFSR
jgi:putative AlgH/UPF0301 family transcriptional regulator